MVTFDELKRDYLKKIQQKKLKYETKHCIPFFKPLVKILKQFVQLRTQAEQNKWSRPPTQPTAAMKW